MSSHQHREPVPVGFDSQGWPLPEVRALMIDNFVRSWTHHWKALVVLFVSSVGLVLFGTWLVTPTWEGRASIEVQPQPMPVMAVENSVVTQAQSLTASQMVKNMVEQARSYNLLNDVIEQTAMDQYLRERSELDPNLRTRLRSWVVYFGRLQFLRGKPAAVNYRVKALEELSTNWISIVPSEGTTVLPIIVNGDSPEMTIRVGNAIMDQLQARADEDLRMLVEKQVEVLGRLVDDARARVASNDQAIGQFKASLEFGIDPAAYAQAAFDAASALRMEKTTFRPRLDALEAELATLSGQLDDVPEIRQLMRDGELLKSQASVSAAIEKDIADLRADIAAKSTVVGPNAPAVKALEVRLADLTKSLEEAKSQEAMLPSTSKNVVETLDPRHQALFERLVEVNQQLSSLRARYASLDPAIADATSMQREALSADVKLQRMLREARLDEDQLRELSTSHRQLSNLLQQDTIFKGIVRRNETTVKNADSSDYPSMLLAGLIALAVGLFTSLVLPIAYDYVNQTLLTSRQIASIPGLRVVASVPSMRASRLFAEV